MTAPCDDLFPGYLSNSLQADPLVSCQRVPHQLLNPVDLPISPRRANLLVTFLLHLTSSSLLSSHPSLVRFCQGGNIVLGRWPLMKRFNEWFVLPLGLYGEDMRSFFGIDLLLRRRRRFVLKTIEGEAWAASRGLVHGTLSKSELPFCKRRMCM